VYQHAQIAYTLRIRNHGPDAARDIELTDVLPPNVSPVQDGFSDYGENGPTSGDTLRWLIPIIKAGETAEVTFKAKVDSIPSNSYAYELVNRARVEGEFDGNVANNSGSASVYAIAGLAPKADELRGFRIHKVKDGESLGEIAQIYFNHPRHWKTIAAANQLADPNLIYPGQELMIPEEVFANGELPDHLRFEPPERPQPETEPPVVEPPTEPQADPSPQPRNSRTGRRNPTLDHNDLARSNRHN
jgi:uncharacterized repeat protein (TIGR01451 family)